MASRQLVGAGDVGGVQSGLLHRLDPRPVIERGVVEQRRQGDVAYRLALVDQHQLAGFGGLADDGGVQAPFLEHAIAVVFAAGLQDRQHPLLAFRQHHLVGGHAGFALGHGVEVEFDADAALARHLHRGRGEARRSHVLDRGDGAGGHQLQRGLDQELFGEWVAHLHRRALFVGGVVEFLRRHRRAVDAVAPGLGAKIDHRQAGGGGGGVEDLVGVGQAHAHGVDQDVAVIAPVEVGLPRHRRHADAVAVAADAGHHTRHQPLGLGVGWIAEAQRVQERDGPGAHGEHVAHDAADARRRALIGLDVGGVVVALHLENAGLPIADIDHARVLPRAADHAWAGGGEFAEVLLGRFVGAVLRPHHAEHAQLHRVGFAV